MQYLIKKLQRTTHTLHIQDVCMLHVCTWRKTLSTRTFSWSRTSDQCKFFNSSSIANSTNEKHTLIRALSYWTDNRSITLRVRNIKPQSNEESNTIIRPRDFGSQTIRCMMIKAAFVTFIRHIKLKCCTEEVAEKKIWIHQHILS